MHRSVINEESALIYQVQENSIDSTQEEDIEDKVIYLLTLKKVDLKTN